MFEEVLPNKKIKWWSWLLIPAFVILGMLGLSFNILNAFWIWLPIFGTAGLIGIYGWNDFKKLVKFPKKNSWGFMVAMVFLAMMLASFAVLLGTILGMHFSANPVFDQDKSAVYKSLSYLWVSLIGEELIVALVTLPVYSFLTTKMAKNKAWIWALIIGSIFFGILHLPTYGWNWYHAIVVIGLARIPFSVSWKYADSLLGGVFAHVFYDYFLILMVLLVR